ncbi:MAG: DUF61 family protein [Bacteroidales bacterium]|nr:DUF61 family protein [ANME-2 cluster archaeon]MDT8402721.1 DUF61 family protein [Bacteroidales bacterium]
MGSGNSGIEKLVQTMNRSLPRQRRSLKELIKEERPMVLVRNDSKHAIDPDELNKIAALVPEYEWNRLLLPIIIELTPDFGATAARIRGEVECRLVIQLIELKKSENMFIVLYMHEIKNLRRTLPTTTQYGFYISL